MASYHQRDVAYYNRKVRPHAFKVGTLVPRKVFDNIANKMTEKLQENLEGPYIVSKAS